jgi:hypothetical protein
LFKNTSTVLELADQFLEINSWPPQTSTNMGSSPPGHRLAESIPWNQFLGSIKILKIPPLFVLRQFFFYRSEEKWYIRTSTKEGTKKNELIVPSLSKEQRRTKVFVPQLSKEQRRSEVFVPQLSKERRQTKVFVPQLSKKRRRSEVFVPQLSKEWRRSEVFVPQLSKERRRKSICSSTIEGTKTKQSLCSSTIDDLTLLVTTLSFPPFL